MHTADISTQLPIKSTYHWVPLYIDYDKFEAIQLLINKLVKMFKAYLTQLLSVTVYI